MKSTSSTVISENEYRVVGPPGTGKTTFLCEQVTRAVRAYCDRSGQLPCECRSVLVSSLTRAAASEVHSRGLDIPSDQVGTLHKHAYQAIGRPTLCVDGEPVKQWNEHIAQINTSWRLTGKRDRGPDQAGSLETTKGDVYLHQYHCNRARLRQREIWSTMLQAFAEAYEGWKRENEYVDFSDVIHDAYAYTSTAPNLPSVIMVDEAQDHDRAELRLVRKWATHCEKVVIIGDPDQNLYEWRGSEPEAFYEVPIPEKNNRVLAQSYRVPRAVHAQAVKMIGRCKSRRPVEYHPRDEDGEVIRSDESITDRRAGFAVEAAGKYLQAGKKVMFLAACEYQLRPLMRELKERAIPFHNPFARDRGIFNPLTPPRGVSAARRLMDYLLPQDAYYEDGARLWTWQELHTWVDACRAEGLLKHGMKSEIARRADGPEQYLEFHDVAECFEEAAIAAMDSDPLAAFRSFVKKERAGALDFAMRVLKRRGLEVLDQTPQAILGTVHSVKGGEADVVFLSPDLSPQGYEQYQSKDRDAVFRLMYVGMTRARETLVLCAPGSRMCVEW